MRTASSEIGRSFVVHTVGVLAVLGALSSSACGDRQGRPNGATCEASAECASGLCYESLCLDPQADDDGDGLVNQIEAGLGTNTAAADSDGDGAPDATEVGDPHQARDSDGDGKIDALESALADSDADGLVDQEDPDDHTPRPGTDADVTEVPETSETSEETTTDSAEATDSGPDVEADGDAETHGDACSSADADVSAPSGTTLYVTPHGGPINAFALADNALYIGSIEGVFVVPTDRSTPRTLATESYSPSDVAADATTLYWTNVFSGEVSMAPMEGGSATALARDELHAHRIVVDGTYVYWISELGVRVAQTTGGGATTLYASATPNALGLAAAGGHVLIADPSAGLFHALAGAPTPELLAAGAATTATLDATTAYFGEPGRIRSVPLAGGDPTLLTTVADTFVASDVAVDGTSLYFWSASDTLAKVPLAGGPATVLASGLFPSQRAGFAVDTSSVYFQGAGQGVVSVPIDGGAPTVLTIFTGNGFTLFGTHLYGCEWAYDGVAPSIYQWSVGKPDQIERAWVFGALDPQSIVSNGVDVLWGDNAYRRIAHVAASGGPIATWHEPGAYRGALAADATRAYWVDENGLWSATIAGSDPVSLAPGFYARQLTLRGTTLFASTPLTIEAYATTGGAPIPLAADSNITSAFAVDASSVYWTTSDGFVRAVAISGVGPVRDLVTPDPCTPAQAGLIATDGANVYYSEYAGGQRIRKVPVGGGAASIIATPDDAALHGLAVDATTVYWAIGARIDTVPK